VIEGAVLNQPSVPSADTGTVECEVVGAVPSRVTSTALDATDAQPALSTVFTVNVWGVPALKSVALKEGEVGVPSKVPPRHTS